jgi:hypothetical protein
MQAEILLYDKHSLKTLNVIIIRQVCCRFYLSVRNCKFVKRSKPVRTYSWSGVLLEKPTGFQIVKKFPAFYGTRMFITTFASAGHLYISWATSIQSIPPHFTFWRSILILFSHLCLCSPRGLLPSDFPIKNPVYASPLPHTRYMPIPFHYSLFYQLKNIGWEYSSFSSSLCENINLQGRPLVCCC